MNTPPNPPITQAVALQTARALVPVVSLLAIQIRIAQDKFRIEIRDKCIAELEKKLTDQLKENIAQKGEIIRLQKQLIRTSDRLTRETQKYTSTLNQYERHFRDAKDHIQDLKEQIAALKALSPPSDSTPTGSESL